jgi:hypothetical protein
MSLCVTRAELTLLGAMSGRDWSWRNWIHGADRFLISRQFEVIQELSSVLWNPNVHPSSQEPSAIPHSARLIQSNIHYEIIFLPTYWSFLWSAFSCISTQILRLFTLSPPSFSLYVCIHEWSPRWSSSQNSWLQTQESRVRFQTLSDFLRSSGSGTGSTQPREAKWGATRKK